MAQKVKTMQNRIKKMTVSVIDNSDTQRSNHNESLLSQLKASEVQKEIDNSIDGKVLSNTELKRNDVDKKSSPDRQKLLMAISHIHASTPQPESEKKIMTRLEHETDKKSNQPLNI